MFRRQSRGRLDRIGLPVRRRGIKDWKASVDVAKALLGAQGLLQVPHMDSVGHGRMERGAGMGIGSGILRGHKSQCLEIGRCLAPDQEEGSCCDMEREDSY